MDHVDQMVPIRGEYTVHTRADGEVLNGALMYTNISQNSNKFYVVQVLKHEKSPPTWHVYKRWGRIGQNGQSMFQNFHTILDAEVEFEQIMNSKVAKGYTRLQLVR